MTIPIPTRASGFRLGAADADVKIDLFIDLQCPHSKKLWPNIMSVLEHYDASSVCVTVHIVTLSNHRQAWDMSLGVFALSDEKAHTAFDFITMLYENQSLFYNSEFEHKTHHELRKLIAMTAYKFTNVDASTASGIELAQKSSQFDMEQFIFKMQSDKVYILGRTPIRYAATKSVWATPTIFVNNADDVPVNYESTFAQWKDLIDPLKD